MEGYRNLGRIQTTVALVRMSRAQNIFSTNPFQVLRNDSVRKNIHNSIYYFGGTFLQFIIAIFTQPIFSRYLELNDFAIIGYFSAIQALIFPLFSMSLPFYYMAQYWTGNDGTKGNQNLSFIMNFLNISNGFIAIISFILTSIYFKFADVSFPLMPFIIVVMSNLFFEKFKTFYLLECRIQKQGLRFFLINAIQILINTSFSLFFVISLHGGAIGRMSGILLGIVCTGSVSLVLLIKENKFRISFKIDWKKTKPALKYCFPLIIGAYAFYPIGNIDRLFLERLKNPSEFGFYNIGLTISGFVSTFFLAFYQSFEPDLYKLIAQKKYNKYVIFTIFYIAVLAVLSVLFILSSETIVSFLTSGRFVKSAMYANIFIVGIFLMQVGGIFEQLFTAFGETRLVMWRTILIGVLSIAINYYLIRKSQFYGANISKIFTSIAYVLLGALFFLIFIYRRKQSLNN